MKLVQQNGESDCGNAVLAMVLGKDKPWGRPGGTSAAAMFKELNRIAGTWEIILPETRNIIQSDRIYVMLVKRPYIETGADWKTGHWIAVEYGAVYDPEKLEPIPIKNYKGAAWIIFMKK